MKFIRRATQLCFDVFFRKPEPVRAPKPPVRTLRSRPRIRQEPELRAVWIKLRAEYFPEQPDLDSYRLNWSNRKHRYTLASCNSSIRRVSIATVMQLPEAAPYLEALVYHEMCHAALGKPQRVNGRRVIHGRDFKALEQRHPGVRPLDAWIKTGGWRKAVKQFRRQQTIQARLSSSARA